MAMEVETVVVVWEVEREGVVDVAMAVEARAEEEEAETVVEAMAVEVAAIQAAVSAEGMED